jgi:outer membrane receptor for ferrienterochelin and colicin
MTLNRTAALVLVATLLPIGAEAQAPASSPPQDPLTFQDTVQVTATRFGEPVVEVPGSISVVTANELRARGATDLRTALARYGVSVVLAATPARPGTSASACARMTCC